MRFDPDPKLIQAISTRRQRGNTHAEILRWLAVSEHLGPQEMMSQVAAAYVIPISETFCINGWWHDGTAELKDEDINRLLDHAIVAVEREKAA